jgi:hypothetical protein
MWTAQDFDIIWRRLAASPAGRTRGGTFVQQPNGLIQKGAQREPGAVVVVSQKDPSERGVDIVALGSLAQILASTATVIVVLTKL